MSERNVIPSVPAVLPLWAILYERELYDYAGELAIPFSQIFLIFFVISGAGFAGYLLCDKLPDLYDKYWAHLPVFTVLTLVVITLVEVYLNLSVLRHMTVLHVLLALVLSGAGFGLGAGLGYILCEGRERTTTLALELGVRTTYVSNLCATMSYPPGPDSEAAKAAAVMAGLLTLLPACLYVMAVRFRRKLHSGPPRNHKPE
jgi:predicted MFS family arabinose efflux permease